MVSCRCLFRVSVLVALSSINQRLHIVADSAPFSMTSVKFIVCVCVVPPAGSGWSSPVLTGSRPAPRSNFTLTLIRTHQAVLFAGTNQTQDFNDSHVIDLEKMVRGVHNTLAVHLMAVYSLAG